MIRKQAYLSGPMTGLPGFNFAAFNEAAAILRDHNYGVFNPAEQFGGDDSLDWHVYMESDIRAILEVDLVVVLPGWDSSPGSLLEVTIALALNKDVMYLNIDKTLTQPFTLTQLLPLSPRVYVDKMMKKNPSIVYYPSLPLVNLYTLEKLTPILPTPNTFETNKETSILQEAHKAVHGDRGKDYGHPIHDFTRTAGMWSGLFIDKLKDGVKFEARDVPLAMNCVKMSREMNGAKRDNRIDGCGYWETLDMIESYKEKHHPLEPVKLNTKSNTVTVPWKTNVVLT